MFNALSFPHAIRGCAASLALALAPATLVAAPSGASGGLELVTAEQRIRLSVDFGAPHAEGTIVRAGGRVSSEALAYRFRLTLTDSNGNPVADGDAWEATVFVAGRTTNGILRPLMFLGSRERELTLPRPLGVRLEAGDSLVFVAALQGRAVASRRFVLVLDYEGLEGGATRLAVAPLPALDGLVRDGAMRAEWRWVPESDGRLLAFAGLPLADVRELSLDDVTTGATVWSTTVRDADGHAVFGKPGEVVRLGAAVTAGHTYRLRATLGHEVGEGQDPGATLLAMILPSRPAAR